MKVLVFGTGAIGSRHAANLETLGATVDPVSMRQTPLSEALARLAAGADAAVIATATELRLPLVEAAARHRVPLYIERPLAADPDTVSSIYRAAGPILSRSLVGFTMRYHPAFRHLAAADLTDAFRYAFEIGYDITRRHKDRGLAGSYSGRPEGGGVVLDLCHELDMAHCLFPGILADVECLGHVRYPGVDIAAQVARAGPVQGTVSMDYLAPKPIRRLEIAGTARRRVLDFLTGTLDDGDTAQAFPIERNRMFLDAMADFLALAQGRQPSDVEYLPRLDLVRPSCEEIAAAHARRVFTGHLDGPKP